MDPESQKLQKVKKSILVIGKTSQGKSTLINNLITPKNGEITE